MESLFFDLIEILKQQEQIIASSLATAKEHNLGLRNNDANVILAVVKKQEALSKKLQAQDRRREAIQQQLAQYCGLDKQAGLTVLLQYAPVSVPTVARDLEQLAITLKESIAQLFEINQLNAVLAKRGLMFTEHLRKIIFPVNNNTYLGSGALNKESKPLSVFDKTI
jgi:flagellar biosynthesis/type III secretory pathway chaperone